MNMIDNQTSNRSLFCLTLVGLFSSGFLVGLLGGLLGACSAISPSEYSRNYSPAIEGQLLKSGKTASGYTLVVAPVETFRSNCYFELKETITDEMGRFKLPALTAEDVGDRALESERRWQVCVKTDRGNRSIWFDSIIGITTGNKTTELTCDLSMPTSGNGVLCIESNSEYRELLTIPD